MKSIRDDIAVFGESDSNYFLRPLNNRPYILTAYMKNNQEYYQAYDLQTWRSAMLKGQQFQPAPFQVRPYQRSAGGTNKISNGSFDKSIRMLPALPLPAATTFSGIKRESWMAAAWK
jgi:hypothetical protein